MRIPSTYQLRAYGRIALIIVLCGDLACRTATPRERGMAASPATPQSNAKSVEGKAGAPLPEKSHEDIGTIATKVQAAYGDYLRTDNKGNPDMTAIAQAVSTMDPALLKEILSSRADFTRLQQDITSVSQGTAEKSTDKKSGGYIEGEVPWDQYQQIEGSIEDPFAKVYTAGKVLIAIGVGAIVAGYFVQVTNKQHANFAAIEKLRASQGAITTLFNDKNLDVKVAARPGSEGAVSQKPEESTTRTPTKDLTLKESLDKAELGAKNAPDNWKYAKERYQGSEMLKYGGAATAIAGVVVLAGASYTSTYYELVDAGKRDPAQTQNPGLAQLMATLAQLEVALQKVYASAP